MAEIKKINGNTLCDDVARTAADAAQETAEDAAKVADVAINNLTGIAKMAEYDGDNKQLLAKKYNTSGGTTNTVLAAPGVAQLTTITVGDKAYAVQSSAWDNVVATYAGEDGLHVLSGKFTSTFGKEVELTETVVPYSAQVQGDWNESDPTSPAYIQNRIGGYKRSEAERLVEYDETTAEYIDVDVTGSGTAMRYRKASDTLVDKSDWVGGKVVIGFDAGEGEQEQSFDIGTGETSALSIAEMKYAAGTIWLVGMTGMVCGIIAPQETDISASADGVSVQAGASGNTVIPKGVWVLDLPWYALEFMGGAATVYHKAVYCGGVVKIPEEYLDTTTAETAQATAETAQATAEEAKTTAETAQATAETAQATAEAAQAAVNGKLDAENPVATGAFSMGRVDNSNVGKYSFATGYNVKASGNSAHAEGSLANAAGFASHAEGRGTNANSDYSHAEGSFTDANGENSHAEGLGTIAAGDASHAQGRYNIEDKSITFAHIVGNGTASQQSNAHTLDWGGNAWYAGDVYVGSTSGTNKDEGSVRLARVSEVPTYTAGDGIFIEDGVIAADMDVLATHANTMRIVPWEKAFQLDTTVPYITIYKHPSRGDIAYFVAKTEWGDESYFYSGFRVSINFVDRIAAFVVETSGFSVVSYEQVEERPPFGAMESLGNVWDSSGYLVNTYTMEDTENKQFYLRSSTSGSTKRFKITVDDTGTLTATEVTE